MLISIIIIVAIISGIFVLILTKPSKKIALVDTESNRKILYYDATHRFYGVHVGIVVPIILILFLFPIIDLIGVLMFSPFTLMAIISGGRMIIESYYYKLIIDSDRITEVGLFNKSKSIYWKKIEKVKYGERTLKISDKSGNKIKVAHWIIGFPTLLEEIKKNAPSNCDIRL